MVCKKIQSPDPPKFLYKYRAFNLQDNLDHTIALMHGRLYFCHPAKLNDPFEFQSMTKHVFDMNEAIALAHKLQPHLKPELRRDSNEWQSWILNAANAFLAESWRSESLVHEDYSDAQLGVFCASNRPNNVRMWSHYGASHTGICVAIRADLVHQRNAFLEVDYTVEMPVVSMIDCTKSVKAYLRPFLSKSREWLSEEEWRCFSAIGEKDFGTDIVAEVIIGARMKDDQREKLDPILQSLPGHVGIFESVLSKHSYALGLKRIR